MLAQMLRQLEQQWVVQVVELEWPLRNISQFCQGLAQLVGHVICWES
jgi:hypothetical protein